MMRSDIDPSDCYVCERCKCNISAKTFVVDFAGERGSHLYCGECFDAIMFILFGTNWELEVEDWVLTVLLSDIWWYVLDSSELEIPLSCSLFKYS